MNDLVSDGIRHGVSATVDHRSCRGCDEARHVADAASNLGEKLASSLSIGGYREHGVSWGSLGAAYELGEMIDVREADAVRRIFWISGRLAHGCDVRRAKPVGHAHLVQIGISNK